METRRATAAAREVVAVIREHNVTFMAGSIAHAAFLSILPLLLLLFIVAGAVGNEFLTEQITDAARDHLSPAGEGLVYEALTNASEQAGASLIGVASLLWGMLRIFRGIHTAFDELYEAESADGDGGTFVEKVVDGAIVFVVIVFATVGTGFAAAALAAVEHPVAELLNPIVLFVGLAIAFFPMYYVFPDPPLSVREALPGTIVAAVGWVLLEVVFGVYADLVNTVGTYETFGAVILLLVWLYGTAFVLLAGAAVNIVVAGRHDATSSDRDGDGSPSERDDGVDAPT